VAIEHPDHQAVNSLGELPQQMREERRETYGQPPAPMGPPGIISDMPGTPRQAPPTPPIMPRARDIRGQNQSLVDAENAPFGLPSTDYLVQTVFDARPINANDFQFYEVAAIDPNGDVGGVILTATLRFTVPAGRVGVVRSIEWASNDVLPLPADPAPGSNIADFSPIFVALGINGFIQHTYERIFQQEGRREVYAIAFASETIDVTFTVNPSFVGSIVGWQPAYFLQMHGNLLDTRGREKQYEPANEYRSGLLK